MSAQHTPGPWKFGFESVDPEWAIVTIEGGLIIANVNADHRQEANARLIAAAPDMLAVLKDVENALSVMGKETTGLLRVRAAIAKAEGRDA